VQDWYPSLDYHHFSSELHRYPTSHPYQPGHPP
jgi:hypothetical protein